MAGLEWANNVYLYDAAEFVYRAAGELIFIVI